ncbi:MAG: hypothetical protein II130_05710 [Bacteroidales bacterium]|jgi:hypothetical protein|nr:hypothetical protein [Bacteroidales bacterium]MBQ2550957.1 hypothetical protein [Bacteroidales bacterium]MBQ3846607.1 hypothetical protein [Bacteroidales bacterium]
MKKVLMIVLAAAALLSTAKNADAQIALGGSAFVAHETGNVVGDPANNNFFGLTLGATYYQHIGRTMAISGGVNYRFAYDPNPKGMEHSVEVPVAFNYFFTKDKDFVPFIQQGHEANVVPFVFAGPTLEYGFGGNVLSAKRFAEGSLKPLNVLVGGGVGLYLVDSSIMFKLGYDCSLMDYNYDNTYAQRRHYIRLGVAFVL